MTIHRGETIRLKETFKDFDKNLVDPNAHEVKIYDPKGVLKDTKNAATKISLGIWYIKYNIPSNAVIGTWKWIWKGTYGSGPGAEYSIEEHTFKVEAL